MDKEVYESIKKYDREFGWAINSNFLRLSVGEFNEIAEAYFKTFGQGLSKTQMTCPACKLTAMKKLGEEYFKAKAEYEPPQTETKAKNKVGRPPKIKLED